MPSAWYNFVHDNASLFGGVVGGCLSFSLLGMKQFYGRPRLSLKFRPDDDGYLSESTHTEGEVPNVTRKFVRVSLTARGLLGSSNFGGLSGAKNCRIYLTAIRPLEHGKLQRDQLHDARPISWPPNKSFEPRDIPRGVTMFANVVSMRKGGLHWHFQIPDPPYGLSEKLLTHAGRLRIAVTATADNAKPVTRHITASIKADKTGFEAEME